MVDDPNIRPSGSFNIATDGYGSGAPISIATSGYLEPDLQVSDIIIGGSGDISVQFSYPAGGGVITGGAVPVVHEVNGLVYYFYPASGGLTTGGDAGFYIEEETNTGVFYPSGQVSIGGTATASGPFSEVASGGISIDGTATVEYERLLGDLVTSGNGDIVVEFNYPASGGLTTGGSGNGVYEAGITRSGMGSPYGRTRREHVNPHHYIMHAHARPITLGGSAEHEFEPANSVGAILSISLDRVIIPISQAPIDAIVLEPELPKLIDFSNFEELIKLARSYRQKSSGGKSFAGTARATFISQGPYIDEEEELMALLTTDQEFITITTYERRDNDDDELLLIL